MSTDGAAEGWGANNKGSEQAGVKRQNTHSAAERTTSQPKPIYNVIRSFEATSTSIRGLPPNVFVSHGRQILMTIVFRWPLTPPPTRPNRSNHPFPNYPPPHTRHGKAWYIIRRIEAITRSLCSEIDGGHRRLKRKEIRQAKRFVKEKNME